MLPSLSSLTLGDSSRRLSTRCRLKFHTTTISGSVSDLFNELSTREKIIAQMEMQQLLAELKKNPPGPHMTIELYAGANIDPYQARPIALIFVPNWEDARLFEFVGGSVALMHRTSVECPYKIPFSFTPEGFRLVDPPEWLQFNGTRDRFMWVSQGENGPAFIPSKGPMSELTNIGPAALERTLDPEFNEDWKDRVNLQQKWQMRERRDSLPRRRRWATPEPREPSQAVARNPDVYDDRPVAAMMIYLTMKPSAAEKTKRVSLVKEHLQKMPKYKRMMETPDPETAFENYGAAASKTLMNQAFAEMGFNGYDDKLTTVDGILEHGLAITYFVPDGVRAWEQVEKAATLEPLTGEKRGRPE